MWSRSSRAGAHVELMEVAGRLQAPIVHATRGKECIEYDNPFDVGMTGLLGFVELEMKAAGFLDFATDLHNPDFAKMADAAGLLGLAAETPEQVQPMLGQALEHDGPALVEVVVNR